MNTNTTPLTLRSRRCDKAASPYTDGEGCPELYWRLQQRLVKNKIEWYEESDEELIADPQDPRTWETLVVA